MDTVGPGTPDFVVDTISRSRLTVPTLGSGRTVSGSATAAYLLLAQLLGNALYEEVA